MRGLGIARITREGPCKCNRVWRAVGLGTRLVQPRSARQGVVLPGFSLRVCTARKYRGLLFPQHRKIIIDNPVSHPKEKLELSCVFLLVASTSIPPPREEGGGKKTRTNTNPYDTKANAAG